MDKGLPTRRHPEPDVQPESAARKAGLVARHSSPRGRHALETTRTPSHRRAVTDSGAHRAADSATPVRRGPSAMTVAGGALSMAGAGIAGWVAVTHLPDLIEATLPADTAPTARTITLLAVGTPVVTEAEQAPPPAPLDPEALVTAARALGRTTAAPIDPPALVPQKPVTGSNAQPPASPAPAPATAEDQQDEQSDQDSTDQGSEADSAATADDDAARTSDRGADRDADADSGSDDAGGDSAAGGSSGGDGDSDSSTDAGSTDTGSTDTGSDDAGSSGSGSSSPATGNSGSGDSASDSDSGSTGNSDASNNSSQSSNSDDSSDSGSGASTTAGSDARGATAPGGVPAATAQPVSGSLPSQLIDTSNWYLTLPTGKEGDPDIVEGSKLAGYHSQFYQLNQARNGVVFTAGTGGATTSGSQYPRSELREMFGSEKASWDGSKGRHTMEIVQAITETPGEKPDVIAGQIHATSPTI